MELVLLSKNYILTPVFQNRKSYPFSLPSLSPFLYFVFFFFHFRMLTFCSSRNVFYGSGLKVMIANGPFCAAEDLQYQPFRALIAKVTELSPNLLILVFSLNIFQSA